MKTPEQCIPKSHQHDADDRRALAGPWSLPLLESLLRREMFEAESSEMSDWYMDLMEEVEQEFRRPFQDLDIGTCDKRCAGCGFVDIRAFKEAVRNSRTLK